MKQLGLFSYFVFAPVFLFEIYFNYMLKVIIISYQTFIGHYKNGAKSRKPQQSGWKITRGNAPVATRALEMTSYES